MKRKNPEFFAALKTMPVGTHVVVTAKMLDNGDPGGSRTAHGIANPTHQWVHHPCSPFHAWVTGATWKCDGEVFPDESVVPRDWDGEGTLSTGWKMTRKTPVLLVRTSAFSREIAVPFHAVQPDPDVSTKAPTITGHPRSWLSELDRQDLRDDVAKMARDPQGRFLSGK